MLMETCRSIIAMDCANRGEVEPMGKQIYETFLPSEVTEVTIMMQKAVNNYDLEMWEDLGGLQAVFEDLATKKMHELQYPPSPCLTGWASRSILTLRESDPLRSCTSSPCQEGLIPSDTTRVSWPTWERLQCWSQQTG